jgi:hypothetical protein
MQILIESINLTKREIMKYKKEILNILKTKPKSELDEIQRLFDAIIAGRSEDFANTSELANQLLLSRSLLNEFCRIYRMCRNNIQDFIQKMQENRMSPEWWYLIELFKRKPIDELVAIRREFYTAYNASLGNNMIYNEQTDTWEKYTGRSMSEIKKSIGLTAQAFYAFRMHVKLGRWNFKEHVKKMESSNYKELFNHCYLI